jgi:hypothetical protein
LDNLSRKYRAVSIQCLNNECINYSNNNNKYTAEHVIKATTE